MDDLAKIVLDNDKRLDDVQMTANDTKKSLDELLKRDALLARSRVEKAAIIAAMLSPIATLLVALLEHH